MIYKTGNLLESTESYICHGVNCQGKMGSGVALAIRQKWPKVFEDYTLWDKDIGLRPGDVILTQLDDNKWVASLATQEFYGYKGRFCDYDAIRECFRKLNTIAAGKSIAIPKIGAGLGGGDWSIIEKIIDEEISNVTCYTLYKE